MRRIWADNLRCIVVLLVVIYHCFYIFNSVGVFGGLGPFTEKQPVDMIEYALYPWFMALLFLLAGMSAKWSLDKRSSKEFFRGRSLKLLVPSTLGLFGLYWIVGYFNVIAGGGIFTGTDAVRMMTTAGADGVQAATRFTVTKESGLPDAVKQRYFEATREEIVVNGVSPTGYPMRMLTTSPAINSNLKPQCEPYGYMLSHGTCSYLKAYEEARAAGRLVEGVPEKTCLCAQMRNCKVWTVGATGWRLKEASEKGPDGRWILPGTAEVFDDYRYGTHDEVHCRH